MTLLAQPASAAPLEQVLAQGPRSRWALVEHAAAVCLLLWWAGPMTARSGGRGPGATELALIPALLLLLLGQPWRRLSRVVLLLSLAVPLGALAMCLWSPTGWNNADQLSSYTLVALVVPGVALWARTPRRRQAVVVAVCAAGLVQFGQGFFAWWGGQDPSVPMVGTFYSWNPFAAFLLPCALFGVALAVRGEGHSRLLGCLAGPCAAAGVVLSSSRATSVLLLVGSCALLATALLGRHRRSATLRWLGVVLLGGIVVVVLSGPPFFAHRASILAAAQAKAATNQSVATNGAYRLQFWQRAVAIVEHRPIAGAGARALVGASDPYVPADYARSTQVHNGYLEALSDGGLLLGVPFLGTCLALLLRSLGVLWSARRDAPERWLRLAAPIALGGVFVHSAVDLDWSFPSDLLLAGVLAGLVLSLTARPSRRPLPWPVYGTPIVALALVAGLAGAGWDAAATDVHSVSGTAAQKATQLRARGSAPFADYRWGAQLLRVATGGAGPVTDTGVPHSDIEWALNSSAAEAQVDASAEIERARALVVLGRDAQAVGLVDGTLHRLGMARAAHASDAAAPVLRAAGQLDRARKIVLRYLAAGVTTDAGGHLQVLLQMSPGPADLVVRCAYAAVPADDRFSQTPDPGTPPAGTDCGAVLQGALS